MVYKGKITPIITRLILLSVTFFLTASLQAQAAETVAFYGYDDCIKIENEDAEVILCPAAGGRVLKYALKSGPQAQKNILYLPKGREGWVWDGKTRGQLPAGRFDIGPEQDATTYGWGDGQWNFLRLGPFSWQVRLIQALE